MTRLINHSGACLFTALMVLVSAGAVAADYGSGEVKIGYVITDEEGNLAVNQETYNTYEGFGLSFNDFRLRMPSGLQFRADLNNITLNNRKLTFEAHKPGLFRLAVRNKLKLTVMPKRLLRLWRGMKTQKNKVKN